MNNKDIIILKDIVNEYKHYFCGNYNIINDMELKLAHIEAIENLLEENRILKDNQTKIIADSFHEKMAEKFDEDFIPKSKLIEALDNGISTAKGWGCEDGAYCVKEEFERLGILEGDDK